MAISFKDLLPKKKPKGKGLYIPAFLKSTATGNKISDDRLNDTNTDLTTKRYGTTAAEVVRSYVKNSPDVSHAVESLMRFCITDKFTIVAKDLENDTINVEATKMAQMIAARIDKLSPQYEGFARQSSIAATSETLVKQMVSNGDCCAELVLDKALLPMNIMAISTNNLEYRDKNDRVVPVIVDSDTTTELDSPAVYIASLSQDPDTPYAESWFSAGIQAIVSSTEFTNDLRKSFRKANLPRVKATIKTKEWLEALSPEVKFDSKKLAAAMQSTLNSIENQINGLNPEDAVINFDTIDVEHLTAGNISSHDSVSTHAKLVNGQMSTGLHTLGSVLGRGESQTTASTETVLFLKMVESLQGRLNEIFSYLFTLALRLQGQDVTVTFAYKKPSLRPEIEEESFLAVKQSRVLEKLSLGFISDEEASIELTGDLPSGNFVPLSGTGFHNASGGAVEESDNLYSNTSAGGDGVNNTKDQKDRDKDTKKKPKTNGTTG